MTPLPAFIVRLFFILFLFSAQNSWARGSEEWSKTDPAINLTHIFEGSINRKGKATGFHHRPQGIDLPAARLKKLLSGPNNAGVYTAIIEILDKRSGEWREKFSSLFPDHLPRNKLILAILDAYKNRTQTTGRKWSSRSPLGFTISGYILKDGRIITAYPIYQPD